MSNFDFGFKKEGYSEQSVAKFVSMDEISDKLASPEIANRLEKFAFRAQKIAPKSDDFLYFTIIFLKSAEASLIDEFGNTKKVGSDNAWGYFDENYKWHGNVKPHRNNNGDIFPEIELKKAARKWIGTPLCVDHKSESVDGIRGIVLDTHYDEKLKQVVGLCAIDKVNYPDLARKVKTGVVRYGSMGTGVEISICSECQNKARTPQEYCTHIIQKAAYGEINVGLKPIEYSLVVQPAEPGAILLRTIASIKQHGQELRNFGVDDLDEFTSKLSEKQASDLDYILYKTCGEDGCSLEQREQIVRGFLISNGFIRNANEDIESIRKGTEALAELARAKETLNLDDEETAEVANRLLSSIKNVKRAPQGEALTSGQYADGSPTLVTQDDQGVSDFTGTGSTGLTSSDSGEVTDSFDAGGVGPESYLTRTASLHKERSELTSIMEDIMKEKKLRQRAEERRKIAYHFGGAHPAVEPATFKSEDYHKYWDMDKHMHPNPANLGSPDSMAPGDKEIKEKQLRAKDKSGAQKKQAYHFGGAHPAVEPPTFKSEDYHKYWDMDKHMHPNPANLGSSDGMVPGDKEIKEKQLRASYQGPRLSTKFKKRMNLDGSINKAASCFEVYAGDKLVIAATAKDIMGPALEQEWDWITSKDYAKAVVAAIREQGLETVGKMLTRPKVAQELPEVPAAPAPDAGAAAPDAGAAAPELAAPDLDIEEAPMDEGAEESPKAIVDQALTDIEERVAELRAAVDKLGGDGGPDVINVNVGEKDGEEVKLSHQILRDLKVALAEANESADELAKISKSLEMAGSLSSEVRGDLFRVSQAALLDSTELLGETSTLLRMARTIADSMVKVSSYTEEAPAKTEAPKAKKAASQEGDLVKAALELRRQRREALLKAAMEEEESAMAHEANDGIGMWENAGVAGVAKDTAEDIARKQPSAPKEHGASPSTGNQDAKQHKDYSGTPSRQVAEGAKPSVKEHAADDDLDASEVHEIAEDEAEEEIEEHEKEMHGKKESDALDQVKAKLQAQVLHKKAEEERQAYRIRVRRAYDLAAEMQRKAMIGNTRAELDHQVDLMLEFDDKAFESFKRSVAAVKAPPSTVKTASAGALPNVGFGEKEQEVEVASGFTDQISRLWDGK